MALTIQQMKGLIQKLEDAQQLDEEIPQAYLDRLEKSAQLLSELNALKPIEWDSIATADQIDKAEAAIHQKLELKNEIEKHFSTCALTVTSKPRGRGKGEKKPRQARRSAEQLFYDKAIAQITKDKKAELELPARGRITEEDQKKLDAAIEKEIKKQKLVAPKV